MYNSENENQLIVDDVVQTLRDYVGVQPDINDQKIKACWLGAQNLDVERVIGQVAIDRCLDPQTPADLKLKSLLIPALANYCYSRALKRFQGTLTDGGYHIEKEATDRNVAKSTALDFQADAETYMKKVIEFLAKENPNSTSESESNSKLTPSVRVIGGEERRASN